MPRQLITLELCDVCLGEHDKETPAVWSSIITINKFTREFMLCEEHQKAIIGDLPNVLEKYGVPMGQQPAKAKSHHKQVEPTTNNKNYVHTTKANPKPCQFCDFIAHNSVGLGVHQHKAHPAELKVSNG